MGLRASKTKGFGLRVSHTSLPLLRLSQGHPYNIQDLVAVKE